MTIPEISTYAELKGLGLVGTGDLTHPDWSKELRQQLEEVDHTGILRTKDPRFKIRYVIGGEVCTVF
jgi:PHP family Zn ribbon phosphoesterase